MYGFGHLPADCPGRDQLRNATLVRVGKLTLSLSRITGHKISHHSQTFINLERDGVEEHREEPVESNGGQFDVDALQVMVQFRQFPADELLQDRLVGTGTGQRLVEVVRRKVLLRYRHQTPANRTAVFRDFAASSATFPLRRIAVAQH